MKLTDISYARAVMEKHGIAPQKRFGQNFLISENVVSRIADTAGLGDSDLGIIEIGPGIGTLTQKLAERYKKVVSIEIDTSLLPVLEDTLSEYDNVKIISGDAMKTDFAELVREEFDGMRVAVCANLPYYITSPVIMRLLETDGLFESVTVMIQKEVADRLVAAPATAEYGAITASIGYYGEAERLFTVPAGDFVPAPKVNSAVVRIRLYGDNKPHVPQDEALFFRTIKIAFEQRRKTLANALSAGFGELTKDQIVQIISDCGHPADIRGERLDVAQFVALSDRIGCVLKQK